MVGRTIGNYRITEKLGEGGMGAVYRAIDQMVERNVAIKVLKPGIASNPNTYERFLTEAKALAKLNHPAIAMLFTFFPEEDEYFMVMEYVPGQNLETLIRTHGAIRWPQAVATVVRILEGVGHAHAQGIVHRDLKPANIMLSYTGDVKITDFGIARVFYTPRLTRESRVVGTMEYLAPERALGKEADERTDIYSIGVILYEMLTGRLPFEGKSDYEIIRAQVEQPPTPLRDLGVAVPALVEDALMKALAKDPAQRHPNAPLFAGQLRSAMAQQEAPVLRPITRETELSPMTLETTRTPILKETALTPPAAAEETVATPVIQETVATPVQPVPEPQRRRPRALVAGGILAFVLVLGVSAYLWQRASLRTPSPAQTSPPQTPETSAKSLPQAVRPSPMPPPAPSPTSPEPTPAAPAEEAPPSLPSVTQLADVKSIFLKPMPEDLDEHLRQEIANELKGRLQVSADEASADAVMSVVIEDARGNRVVGATGRLIGVKGAKHAIATLSDRTGQHQLWTATVDDRHLFASSLGDDIKRLASRLAKRLRSDLH